MIKYAFAEQKLSNYRIVNRLSKKMSNRAYEIKSKKIIVQGEVTIFFCTKIVVLKTRINIRKIIVILFRFNKPNKSCCLAFGKK